MFLPFHIYTMYREVMAAVKRIYVTFSTKIYFLRSPEPKNQLQKLRLYVCFCRHVDPRLSQKPYDQFCSNFNKAYLIPEYGTIF